MKFTIETVREIWCDEDGECHTVVKQDSDGVGLVELQERYGATEVRQSMLFAPGEARLIAKAMIALADELDAAVKK